MNEYIKSPLNYVGGKFKLLPQIIPLFPTNINRFFDLFGGGFNVGINIKANQIIYNDTSQQVYDLLSNLYNKNYDEIHNKVCEIISAYGLSRSDLHGYEYYNCHSKDNKIGYLKLRDDYNKNPDYLKFYTLVTCSFSNQIRFNSKGEFNMPYGKRDYNKSLQSKLKDFMDLMNTKNIEFYNSSFIKFGKYDFIENDFLYCDPPYFNSTATYNENNGWNDADENELLIMLETANVKWALSNNFKTNPNLKEWAERNGYIIHYLNGGYGNCNYHKKDKSEDIEVLITNY